MDYQKRINWKHYPKRCYYSNTDAIIYVVDSVDKERIGISKNELVSMLDEEELKKGLIID